MRISPASHHSSSVRYPGFAAGDVYTPCVAAVASIRRELGGRWAFIVVLWQCLVAWVVALIAYMIAGAVM